MSYALDIAKKLRMEHVIIQNLDQHYAIPFPKFLLGLSVYSHITLKKLALLQADNHKADHQSLLQADHLV